MSYHDLTHFYRQNYKELTIYLHTVDDYEPGFNPMICVPCTCGEMIDVDYDNNNVVTKIKHWNDFGASEQFETKEDLIAYIDNNWDSEDYEELNDTIIPLLNTLDFSKLQRKVA